MKTKDIAMICHGAIQALRGFMGEATVAWDEATNLTRNKYLDGVQFHLDNPDAGAEEGHASWMKRTGSDVLYDDLDDPAKAERVVFTALVKECAKVPDTKTVVRVETKEVVKQVPVETIPVKYIGIRERYADGIYGTMITWTKGETILVPAEHAVKMLRHPDVWVKGDRNDAKNGPDPLALKAKAKKDGDEEEKLQQARDAIAQMNDVESVKRFVHDNFGGQKMHHNIGLEKAKEQAMQLVDQFGTD